jgi:1-acyl-sn-glycerol-3-phosphate acyltransferase
MATIPQQAPTPETVSQAMPAPAPAAARTPGLPDSSWLLYEATYALSSMAMTVAFSLRTQGRRNIPGKGPALVIANHQSYLDPLLIGIAARRHLCFLARKTLFRNRFFTRLISGLNAVPVDQEGIAKEGIRTVLEQLRLGQAVVVFPEGERTADGVMHALKPGVHLVIRKSGAPLVPVGIAGAFAAWSRRHKLPRPAPLFLPANPGTIAVAIGKPLDGRRYAKMPRAQALQELFAEIAQVQEQAEILRRK